MNRTRRALLGFASDTTGQIVIAVGGLVMTPLILRGTSQSQYGFWLTALSVVSYLGLIDMGGGVALTRAVAATGGSADRQKINRIVSSGLCAFLIAGAIYGVVGYLLSFRITHWFRIPDGDAPQVVAAFRVVVLSTSIALPLTVFSSMLCGFQKMAIDNLLRLATGICSLVLTALFLELNWGIIGLSIATLLSVLFGGLFSIYVAYKQFPALRFQVSAVNRGDLLSLLGFGGYFQLGKLANTIALNSSNVIIAFFGGALQVPPFMLTGKLAALFSVTLASKVPMAVFPGMAELYGSNNLERMRTVLVQMSTFATRLAVVGLSVCALGTRDFVSLWVGESQFAGHGLLLVFCYSVLQDTISRGTGGAIFATGQLRGWSIACLAEAVISVGAAIVLMSSYGIVGAALGPAIGRTLTTMWIVPLLVCRAIQMSAVVFFRSGVIVPLVKSLPGFGFTAVLSWALAGEPAWWKLLSIGTAAVLGNLLCFEGMALAREPLRTWNTWRASVS